ncbi:MAG: PD40 domain-containing protein, partial [Deltaproteobacteria bacterium]|nr:PD40 domain-containing protein [Deltaproteobacteria bacterium]
GYAGDHCESCAQGYHQDGLGSCVADEHCDPSSCNGHGSCDDSTGVVTCTCTGGFTGPYCGQCGGCAIGDTCHAADTLDPDNPCQSCQPGISAGDWSPVDDDTPCVDDDVCNGEETCQAGVCTDGQDLNCNDDDDPCTDDLCDPQTGCYWEFNTEPCDDSNPRTTDDSCDGAGTCRGLVDLDQDGVADYGYAAVCASDETEACNDNCIGVANADQADLDGNGVGDACDLGTVAGQYIGGHAWSPDSTRIALIQCAAGQGYACDLIVADPDLTHAQIIHDLVDSGGLYGWQDGWIYFRRYAVSGLPSAYAGDGEVWRIMPDGNGLSQVTNTLSNGIKAYDYPSYANIGTVRWGKIIPGTNWIYIKAHDGNGWYRTYRCNADSCDEPGEVVGISGDYGWGSGLSQAGDRLYFGDSWDHDQPMTWISTALDGSDPVTLVHPLQSLSCFVGSPDGQTVAYVEERGARVLRLVDADGTDDRALLGDGTELMITFWQDGANRSGVMENDIWSPGSRYLLFGSDRAGDFHIFRIGSDGTGLVQMTDGAYHDFGPSFSPDGRSFSYYRLPVGYDDSSSPYPTNLVVEPTCLDFHDWPNSILVTGGTLAGQALDPAAPAIRVGPSASISGTIETQIANMAGESGWVFPVCGTPSWGDPASSYWTQNSWFHLGTGAQTFNVNLTAPDTPGRYYIFMAGSYEMDCGDVLSLTRWQDPPEIWGDGNDVADWELAEALQARKHGKVCARFEVPGMGTWKIAAAAVEVIVE